jgi:hypothetical protein
VINEGAQVGFQDDPRRVYSRLRLVLSEESCTTRFIGYSNSDNAGGIEHKWDALLSQQVSHQLQSIKQQVVFLSSCEASTLLPLLLDSEALACLAAWRPSWQRSLNSRSQGGQQVRSSSSKEPGPP